MDRLSLLRCAALALCVVVVLSSVGTTAALAQGNDANWAGGFALPGFDAPIRCATSFAGDLVVAGGFTNITDRALNHVARWDGARWQPLGAGVAEAVFDVTPYAGKLAAGRNDYRKIVIDMWDGSVWSSLPDLPSSRSTTDARVLLEYAGQLVVAGSFLATVDGSTTLHIARWDGTGWHAMGDGFNAPVHALAVYGDDLIAVGSFTMTGSSPVHSAARWDGESWQPMGDGIHDYYADTIATAGGFLYAAGNLQSPPLGAGRCRIDRWNGSSWSTWMSDLTAGHRVASVAAGLVVLGRFEGHPGGSPALRLWNGHSWRTLASEVRGDVMSIQEHGSNIVLAGSVSGVDATDAYGVVAWTDPHPGLGRNATPSVGVPPYGPPASAPGGWQRLESWRALHNESGAGIDDIVYSLCTDASGRLIAGGKFQRAGNTYASGIAAWNGSAWESLGLTGIYSVYSIMYAVHAFEDRIIAGSWEVLSWDGAAWEQLGTLQSRGITDLTTYRGQLIASGEFGNSGPITPMPFYVAAWDGTTWTSLGRGFDSVGGQYNHVFALEVWNDHLIVAGGFASVAGIPAPGIASWDGNSWSALGGGLLGGGQPGPVFALTTWEGDLIAGGGFFVGSSRVARWDGTSWTPLGDQDPGTIGGLVVLDGKLYAATGGSAALPTTIAVWDGTRWNPVPGAPNWGAYALAAHDGELYAGGDFSRVGGTLSAHIARWSPPVAKAAAGSEAPRFRLALARGFSNPVGTEARLLLALPENLFVRVSVQDVRGRLVRSLVSGPLPAGESSLHWDGCDQAGQRVGNGVYFVRVQAREWTGIQKVVRLGDR